MDLKTLTLSVCDVAKRAGSFIWQERQQFHAESIERKHAHDYVSYVDKQSEQLIVSALRDLLPEAGFITEEGSATHTDEQYCWVIDPLDGTTNFIHHFPPYAVSIGLKRGSQIMLGVVYEICADECFYAWLGGGSHLNGQPLQVNASPLSDALVCFQLPYDSDAYSPVAQSLIRQYYGRVASIRMLGSAAIALCYVAAGRLDAYAEMYIGQWDYMAGALIVSEAGGCCTDFDGSTAFTEGNSIVATNGLIHSDILSGIAVAM
ncbi:MAG: inositol monophosphatase [Prevotella sp.]|nr:inositol monophosphatase [Prevotella sp.]